MTDTTSATAAPAQQTPAKLQEIRTRYPGAYDHMSDGDLAGALYRKFYASKMTERDFNARIGLDPYDNLATATGTAIQNAPGRMAIGYEGTKQAIAEGASDLLLNLEQNADDYASRPSRPAQFDALVLAPGSPLAQGGPDAAEQLWQRFRDPAQRQAVLEEMGRAYANMSLQGQLRRQSAQADQIPIDVAPGSAEALVSGAIGSVVEQTPAIAASVATGSVVPGVVSALGMAGGQAYGQGRDQGLSPEQAREYASLYAAAEAIPEALPLGVILREGGPILLRMGQGAIAEGVQEGFTEALQFAIDKGYVTPDMPWSEAWPRIKDAALTGAIAGPMMSVVAMGGQQLTSRVYDGIVPSAEQRQQALTVARGGIESVLAGVRALFPQARQVGPDRTVEPSMTDLVNTALEQRGFAPIVETPQAAPETAPGPIMTTTPDGRQVPDLVAGVAQQREQQAASAAQQQSSNAAPQQSGSVVDRIIGVESGGNATAQNPNSSAGGLGQFIDSTWLSTVRRHAPELAGESDAQILARKKDGSPEGIALQRRMLEAHTGDNQAALQAAGIEPTAGATYAAHFLGVGGATEVLRQPDATPIEQIVNADVINANPFLRGMTVGDFKAWTEAKMAGASTAGIGASAAGSTVNTSTGAAPLDPQPEGALAPIEPLTVENAPSTAPPDPAQATSIQAQPGSVLPEPVPSVEPTPSAPVSTPAAPVEVTTPQDIERVRAEVNTAPTPAQIEAGNYKKGHVTVQGLNISIENPKGSIRRGTDPNGQAWEVTMPADYGYIKRTTGADGDHVDVYIGDNPQSNRVYIVDQINLETGAFDEHKVILGASNMDEAKFIYDGAFSDGKGSQRRASMTRLSMADFRQWLDKGDARKPFAGGVPKRIAGKAAEQQGGTTADPAVEPTVDALYKEFIRLQGVASTEQQRFGHSARPNFERLRKAGEDAEKARKRWMDAKRAEEEKAKPKKPEPHPTTGNTVLSVEGDEASATYVPSGNFIVRRGQTPGQSARETVVARGRGDEIEHIIAFDGDGNLVANGKGAKRTVGFSAAFEKLLDRHDAGLVVHHNHPSNSSFSPPDVAMAFSPGLAVLWAHGHHGWSYRAEVPEAVKRNVWSRGDNQIERMNIMAGIARKRFGELFRPYAQDKGWGDIQFNQAVSHAAMQAWHEAGVLDYDTNYVLPEALSELQGYAETLKDVAYAIKKWTLGTSAANAYSPDRDAKRNRYPGDVGTVPWRGAETAEARPDAKEPRKGGASDDRAETGKGRAEKRLTVTTPTGQKIEVVPEIVTIESLTKATGELQPRDRSRAASDAQIEDMAINLDPDRLLPGKEADRGAPIVGPDGVVESGNGRVGALRRAAEAYPEKYLAYIKAVKAAGFTFEPQAGTPILVLRRVTPMSDAERVEFVNAANTSAIARMSATEQAMADARLIDRSVLDAIEPGRSLSGAGLGTPGNKFTKAFLAKLPQAERSSLVDASGQLNADGVRRIQNALLAAAYGDAATVAKAAEATDDNARAITGALIEVSADWAGMRRDIEEAGADPAYDLTDALMGALKLLDGARTKATQQGRPVKALINEALGQIDMLSGSVDPLVREFVEAFYTEGFARARGRDKITALLRSITTEVQSAIQPQLLGSAPTPEEVIGGARRRSEKQPEQQGEIFAARSPGGRAGEGGGTDRRSGVRAASGSDQRGAGDRAEPGSNAGGVGTLSRRGEGDAGSNARSRQAAGEGQADGGREGAAAELDPDVLERGADQPMPKYVPMYAKTGVPARPENGTLQIGQRSIAVPDLDSPQRREGIRTRLEDIIGRRLYFGKIKGKSRLGFYKRTNSEVRMRNYDDVEVMAHEMAHFLDMHYSRKAQFASKGLPEGLKNEVKQLSYTSNREVVVSEGFAEFVRLWLTNYAAAQKAAPKFTVYFETVLAADAALKKKMERLQEDMHRWFYQGAHAQLRAKSGENYTPAESIIRFMQSHPAERFRQEAIDKIHAAKVIERTVNGEISEATRSAYKQFQLVNGAESIHEAIVRDGTPEIGADGSYQFNGESLTAVFWPVAKKGWKQFDLLMDYFKARRAAELKTQKRENLFTPQEIRAGLALGIENPVFEQVFEAFQSFNGRMLDWYVQMGLITKDQREAFGEANKNYVPFHRITERISDGKRAEGGSGSITKRLKGGTANVADIAENIIEGLFSNVRSALIARAKTTLYRSLMKHQDGALFAVQIPTDSKLVKTHMGDMASKVAKVLVDLGLGVASNGQILGPVSKDGAPGVVVDVEDIATVLEMNPQLLEFWMLNQPPKTDGDTFVDSAIIDGERVYFEVREPLLVEMLSSMGGMSSGVLLNALYRVKNFQTRMVTNFMQFLGPNAWRDTLSAAVLSKNKFWPVYDTLIGMGHAAMQTPLYKEFRLQGAGYGTRVEARTEETRSRRALDLPARNAWDRIAKIMAGYDRFASAFEYGSRVGDYRRGRMAGKGKLEAAWEAREITTDFAKIGRNEFWAKFIRTVPFMNAGIQGLDKTAREIAEVKGKMTVKNLATLSDAKAKFLLKGSVLTAMTIILWALNADDDRYQGLTDDERARFWHVWLPDGTHVQIPRPYDIGHIFASIPEAMLNFARDRDGEAAAKQLAWVTLNSMPIGDYPGLMQPYMEAQANRNFAGAPIVPENMQDRPGRYQFTDRTPIMYRWMGETMGVSPLVAEHYAKGYFRYLEQFVADGTEAAFWNYEEWGERPFARGPVDYMTHQFIGRTVPYRTRWTEGYFELKTRAAGMRSAFNAMQANAIRDRAPLDTIARDRTMTTLVALDRTFASIDRAFEDQDAFMASVKYNPELSAEEKERQIDAYYAQKNAALADAYQQIKAALDEAEASAQ